MVHYVKLARLPDDLRFPENLQSRIWYDPSAKRLTYDGYMSKATFDRLESLHTDSEYRRALEDLFRVAIPEDPAEHSAAFTKAVAFVLVALLAVGATTLLWWFAN